MPSDQEVAVRVTLLGTGTSTGVPVIGCTCRVCTSTDERDRRLRCSCHVEANGVHLQIDTGPDFRVQALRFGIPKVDAVLVTHHHFDHIAGLDDLRPYFFGNRAPIPCFALPETASALRQQYGYIFHDRSYPGVPHLEMHDVDGPFEVGSRDEPSRRVRVEPLRVYHGSLPVAGFRIGRFAYVTDTNHIPPEVLDRLVGVDVLVLDALRHEPHATHFSIAQAIEVARGIGARQTAFVHMTHSVLHAEEEGRFPDGMGLGYDGQRFRVD